MAKSDPAEGLHKYTTANKGKRRIPKKYPSSEGSNNRKDLFLTGKCYQHEEMWPCTKISVGISVQQAHGWRDWDKVDYWWR